MRDYELMFILKPDLEDEEIAAIKDRLKKIISDFGGEFLNEVDGWGRRRMAYKVEEYQEGFTVFGTLKAAPTWSRK